MQLKLFISLYLLNCKQMNMFIEWMSEDSIDTHCERWTLFIAVQIKMTPETCLKCLFFMYTHDKFWKGKKKQGQNLQLMSLYV